MVTQNERHRMVELLVINPNSSKELTKGLDKMIDDLGYAEVCGILTFPMSYHFSFVSSRNAFKFP
jgi:Asp/Glu/hydantoin racemase